MALLAPAQAEKVGLKPVPGEQGLPWLGMSLDFVTGRYVNDRTRYDKYGPVYWTSGFGRTIVMVTGPEALGEVFANRDKAFASGPGWSFLIGPFFRRGLMLLDFEEHHQNRRIMQQAFTKDRLVAYLDSINPTIAGRLDTWQDKRDFRLYRALKQTTLDVASRTFAGQELGPEAERLNRSFDNCVRASTSLVRLPVPGGRWAKGLAARRYLEDYLYERLPAARAGTGDDLLTALCHVRSEDGDRFSDGDVVDHMIFLLMAAHDTSTITAATMAYEMARHPEWQERCRAESLALGKPVLSYDDIDRLPSLDLVMKESLRVVSPVPGVARETVKDAELLGYHVPKGSLLMVGIQSTHRMHEHYKNPRRFDPERFAEPRREDKAHHFAFTPFGGGVHKCIGMYFGGMEVKAILHQMLLEFEWTTAPGYKMPLDWTALPKPRDGLPVTLRRR